MIEILENRIYLDNDYEIREYMTLNGIVRTLYSDNSFESLTFVDEKLKNELCNSYLKFYNLPVDLNPNGNNYLVLGGGAFSYPKYYISKYTDKKMTVVEINEKCIEIAKKYFFLDDLIHIYDPQNKRLNIVVDDAVKYVKECKYKYDYIFIDLFYGMNPISEMFNDDNLINVKRLLKEDGILIVNYIISEKNLYFYRNEIKKIIKIMDNYKIISKDNYFNNNMGNVLLILSNNKINIPANCECIELNEIINI